jgi:hypothetical protein
MKVYKIFPSIGIARMGESEDPAHGWFLGPEAPGMVPPPPYRDQAGKMKRQGARFRIYEYERDAHGIDTLLREVVADRRTRIRWSVHLVNSKAAAPVFPPSAPGVPQPRRNVDYAAAGLVIDAGNVSTMGVNASPIPLVGRISFVKNGHTEGTATVGLGSLRTDEHGRLIVVGSNGESQSPLNRPISNFANNDGWYDNVADGPVTATVQIGAAAPLVVQVPAWVVVAPPSYAPGIDNVTTWFDQAEALDAWYFNPLIRSLKPSFTRHIYPILKRTVLLQWVEDDARHVHGDGQPFDFLASTWFDALKDNSNASQPKRATVLGALAVPPEIVPGPSGPRNMPDLNSGLNPAKPWETIPTTLTRLQYERMKKWANGNFVADWTSVPVPVPIDNIPLAQQPAALTRAALEGCIGSPFYPGIESTYIMAQPQTYEGAYRIRRTLPPGYLTEFMALPWQADFNACGDLWWPAQRPVSVRLPNGTFADFARGVTSMGTQWSGLGFIVPHENVYQEE